MVDVLCVGGLAAILDSARSLTAEDAAALVSVEQAIVAKSRRQLYGKCRPQQVIIELEDLRQRLEFESDTEGHICTRAWYIHQLCAIYYANYIGKLNHEILKALETLFMQPSRLLVEAKCVLCAGVWLERSIEACSKASDQTAKLHKLYISLQRYNISELNWPDYDIKSALFTIEKHRREIMLLLAKIVPELITESIDSDLPDMLGSLRARIGDQLVELMVNKNIEGFVQLFDAYFRASLAIHDQVLMAAKDPNKEAYTKSAWDALLDVLAISGLAYLFTELDGIAYKSIVAEQWDKYLQSNTNQKQMIKAWLNPIAAKTSMPFMSSSATQRFRWNQSFVQALDNRGVDINNSIDDWSLSDKPRVPNNSVVIESLHIYTGHMFTEPQEYFVVLYLSKLDAAQGLIMPNAVQECIRNLEYEQKQRDNSNGGSRRE